MNILPVCSKGFATLIRAMKKLDLKCRHPWVPIVLAGKNIWQRDALIGTHVKPCYNSN
jgi:hypothetical protein